MYTVVWRVGLGLNHVTARHIVAHAGKRGARWTLCAVTIPEATALVRMRDLEYDAVTCDRCRMVWDRMPVAKRANVLRTWAPLTA